MSNLDPRVEAIRKEYGLDKNDVWELPQKKGTYCVKHAALEVVAAKAKIAFEMPQIIEADGGNGVAALCVRGTMGDRSEWSIGEASPKSNKNAYPWAMAEKRAKDRVILKLVGLHGLAYSEEEAEDFKESAPKVAAGGPVPALQPHAPLSIAAKKIIDDLRDATDLASYKATALAHEPTYQTLSETEKDAVTRVSNSVRVWLKGKAA